MVNTVTDTKRLTKLYGEDVILLYYRYSFIVYTLILSASSLQSYGLWVDVNLRSVTRKLGSVWTLKNLRFLSFTDVLEKLPSPSPQTTTNRELKINKDSM